MVSQAWQYSDSKLKHELGTITWITHWKQSQGQGKNCTVPGLGGPGPGTRLASTGYCYCILIPYIPGPSTTRIRVCLKNWSGAHRTGTGRATPHKYSTVVQNSNLSIFHRVNCAFSQRGIFWHVCLNSFFKGKQRETCQRVDQAKMPQISQHGATSLQNAKLTRGTRVVLDKENGEKNRSSSMTGSSAATATVKARPVNSIKKRAVESRLFAPTASSRARATSSSNRVRAISAAASSGMTFNVKTTTKKNTTKSARKSTRKTKSTTATATSTTTTTTTKTPQRKRNHTKTVHFASSPSPSPPPPAPSAAAVSSSGVADSVVAVAAPPLQHAAATPVVKRIRPIATPRSKRSILSQKAHRPTPQSRQAKRLAHEREKIRLQSNSMYTTQNSSIANKCRISGQPKRLGSALRLTRRSGNESVTKKGRTLIDGVSKALATPGNDRIQFGRVRFSPTSGATMKKINFNKPAPISTPNSRRDMIDRLTAAMSSISMKQHVEHKDSSTNSSKQRDEVALSPLTVPRTTSVTTPEKCLEEDSTIDEEVQQLLSTNCSPPLVTSPRSAFKRLRLERSHSPITVAPKSVNRDASDPLGRTLKCQADVQSKDAIRAFCSGDCETESVEDPFDDQRAFDEEDEEAVSFFFVSFCVSL